MIFTLIIAFSLTFSTFSQTFTTASPSWFASPSFRAGIGNVISSAIPAYSNQTFTLSYTSPLPSPAPYFAYGIKSYRGIYIFIFSWRLSPIVIFYAFAHLLR